MKTGGVEGKGRRTSCGDGGQAAGRTGQPPNGRNALIDLFRQNSHKVLIGRIVEREETLKKKERDRYVLSHPRGTTTEEEKGQYGLGIWRKTKSLLLRTKIAAGNISQ